MFKSLTSSVLGSPNKLGWRLNTAKFVYEQLAKLT